jgi:hypothetical protein
MYLNHQNAAIIEWTFLAIFVRRYSKIAPVRIDILNIVILTSWVSHAHFLTAVIKAHAWIL